MPSPLLRRMPLAVPALLALLCACLVSTVPTDAHAQDRLKPAVKTSKKSVRRAVNDAYGILDGAVDGFEKRLRQGTVTDEAAATLFGNALIQYVRTVKETADEASDAFLETAADRIDFTGDDEEPGTQAGDGGSYDALTETLRSEVARARKRAVKRTSRFVKQLAKHGGPRVAMRARFGDWTFDTTGVADGDGVIGTNLERPTLWFALATRLPDGRVVVSAAGGADAALDEQFDLRLASRTRVLAVGEFVLDGGLEVDAKNTWGVTDVLGDPQGGDGVAEGNRTLTFGREPEDDGVLGLQATLFEHAGFVSVP